MLGPTHEARGVVVTRGLGVSEGLQDRVGLDDLVLQVSLQRTKEERVKRNCSPSQHVILSEIVVL